MAEITRYRRVARQGEDPHAVPGARLPGRGQLRPRPGSAGAAPTRCRPSFATRRGRTWAWTSEGDFKPYYVVPASKKRQVAHLRAALKDADQLLLATDPDREGESISYHLGEVLKPQGPGAPGHVPRDHAGGRPGRHPERARDRREPRAGAGEPPDPRPALRLHALARPLEEGADRPQRRPGAERRGPADRRARGGPAGVPSGHLLGRRGAARRPEGRRVPGHPGADRRGPRGDRPRLRLEWRPWRRAGSGTWTSAGPRGGRGGCAATCRGA